MCSFSKSMQVGLFYQWVSRMWSLDMLSIFHDLESIPPQSSSKSAKELSIIANLKYQLQKDWDYCILFCAQTKALPSYALLLLCLAILRKKRKILVTVTQREQLLSLFFYSFISNLTFQLGKTFLKF